MLSIRLDFGDNVVDRRLHERFGAYLTRYSTDEHVDPQRVTQIHQIDSKTNHWFVETHHFTTHLSFVPFLME